MGFVGLSDQIRFLDHDRISQNRRKKISDKILEYFKEKKVNIKVYDDRIEFKTFSSYKSITPDTIECDVKSIISNINDIFYIKKDLLNGNIICFVYRDKMHEKHRIGM